MFSKAIQLSLATAIVTSVAPFPLFAEEAICHKCEIIREENKKKNFNDGFVYYEDYLKKHPEAQNGGTNQENP